MIKKEAIKWLENLKNDIGKMQFRALWDYAQAIDEIIKLLQAETKWIPVSERLPQLEDYVIVSLMWGEVDIMALDWDDGEINWITQEMSIRHDKEDVVAWMPLPRPYREDGEV